MSLMINVLFWTQISLSNYNANTTKVLRERGLAYVFIQTYATQSHLENERLPEVGTLHSQISLQNCKGRWVLLHCHAATYDFNLTFSVCLGCAASVLVFILILNKWLIMWKVKVAGGMLPEYGWRQKKLCVFGDHNCFFFSPCTAWKCCTHCPEIPTVCQCHSSRADQGSLWQTSMA